jgi:large subunit ribosomal protein L4
MAAPTAPLLQASGQKAKDVTLDETIFGADAKTHLVHETVRAEQNAARAGTRGVKTRGLVSGGRAKPWRQKGTGRARAGTIRAPHFEGGGVAFLPRTQFAVKVNRKVAKAAFRTALAAHVRAGTLALLDPSGFDAPSTSRAAAFVAAWDKDAPLLVVIDEAQEIVAKSFRNLEKVVVTVPAELRVTELVWARSILITEAALDALQARAGGDSAGNS